MTLGENSDSKIAILKLQADNQVLQNKNTDLLSRIKELEVYIEKLNEQKKEEKDEYEQSLKKSRHHKKALSEFSSETSIRHIETYENGSNELGSIIRNYEERGIHHLWVLTILF